jgi:hypothetical protein
MRDYCLFPNRHFRINGWRTIQQVEEGLATIIQALKPTTRTRNRVCVCVCLQVKAKTLNP